MPRRAHRGADLAPIRSTSAGSKVAAQHSGDGIDRGPPGVEPGQALLVHLGRDAEPVGGEHLALALGQRAQPLLGSTGAVPKVRVSWPRPSAMASSQAARPDGLAQHRRHAAGVGVEPPDAGELGDLLAQRHPRRPGRRPRVDLDVGSTRSGSLPRCSVAGIGRSRGSSGGRGRPAQHQRRSRGSRARRPARARDQGDEHGRWRRGPSRGSAAGRWSAAGRPAPTRGCCRSRRPTARPGRRRRARRRPRGSPGPTGRWPRRSRSVGRAGRAAPGRPRAPARGRRHRGASSDSSTATPAAACASR